MHQRNDLVQEYSGAIDNLGPYLYLVPKSVGEILGIKFQTIDNSHFD